MRRLKRDYGAGMPSTIVVSFFGETTNFEGF